MAKYSHSRISTFEQCKFKYKLQYIDKVEVDIPTTIEAFMGDMVHRTLEKLYKDLSFQKINSKEEILKFYNKLWKQEWDDNILIVKKEYTSENYRKMGEQYLTEYFNRYKPFDEMKILGLETQDMLDLSDGNQYHIRIDKLGFKDNTYYVVDYKTNRQMKDQQQADEDRQLAMYSIWVKNKYPDAKKIVLKWNMLAFDKEVNSERTNKELEEIQEEVISKIKNIENCSDFPTVKSALCDYCVFKQICPEWKHLYEIEEKTPLEFKEDDGVKLVNEYSKLKIYEKKVDEKLDEIKGKLLQFANSKNVNRIFGSNQKATIWSKDCEKFPKANDLNHQEFINIIKQNGLFEKFSKLDQFKLEKAFEKKEFDKEILELLKPFVKKEKIERIYLSKK